MYFFFAYPIVHLFRYIYSFPNPINQGNVYYVVLLVFFLLSNSHSSSVPIHVRSFSHPIFHGNVFSGLYFFPFPIVHLFLHFHNFSRNIYHGNIYYGLYFFFTIPTVQLFLVNVRSFPNPNYMGTFNLYCIFFSFLFPQFICSYVFFPIPFFMGTSIRDCRSVARLIGLKTFTNEFVAYDQLGGIIKNKKIFSDYVMGNHTDWHYAGDDLWLPSFDGGLKILKNGILEVCLVILFFLPLLVPPPQPPLTPCHIQRKYLRSCCKYLIILAILKILNRGILVV